MTEFILLRSVGMTKDEFVPFDADELILDKDYVIGIMSLVEKRWNANGTPKKFIYGIKVFKVALRATPDFMFKNFWKQILIFINMLQYENGKAQAKSRGESWIDVMELIPDKINEGDFDLK